MTGKRPTQRGSNGVNPASVGIGLLAIAVVLVLASVFLFKTDEAPAPSASPAASGASDKLASSGASQGVEPTEVSLVAVGDDLLHDELIAAAKTGNTYDFDNQFANIRADVQAADIAIINQETILTESDYSGYPNFGSPHEAADSIANAGFNVVTHATNHVLDRGTDSIRYTLNYWAANHLGVSVLGIHDSAAAASRITVVEKNGIRIAMLDYTYGMNGYTLPTDEEYLVDVMSDDRKAQVVDDIRRARATADLVVVFAHWGTEYQYSADDFQQQWGQLFADEGVDLVIGGHPHVVEPLEYVVGKDGNKMPCFWSLGNFISAQSDTFTMLGGMAKVSIVKDGDGARVKTCTLLPIVTHIGYGLDSFTTYKLSDYTEQLASQNYITAWSGGQAFSKAYLEDLFAQITGQRDEVVLQADGSAPASESTA